MNGADEKKRTRAAQEISRQRPRKARRVTWQPSDVNKVEISIANCYNKPDGGALIGRGDFSFNQLLSV